jgi:ferredoxin--NADP+ reductase
MFDRLPVPFGLVRYGVAPDHAKIKNVTSIYQKTAEQPGFSFLGNVCVGRDISVEELKKFYDAILLACGTESDRRLGIPGEDLPGSYTATEFVAWYNGHPAYRDHKFNLSGEVAVVAGQGNVAIDVCRILCKTVEELKVTDIARHALEALAQSNIREVRMVGRRGPAQAAFTPVEIREFGELADCDVVIVPEDLEISAVSQAELDGADNARRRKNLEIMRSFAARRAGGKRRKFILHFLKSPVALTGTGRVRKVVLEKNELVGDPGKQKAKGTGVKEDLGCDIFFRSVGYQGIPLEGVPFHEQEGIFPNKEGRILKDNQIMPGLYAAGWIKRGPSGVIGTNKPDSEETVARLLEDVGSLKPCERPDTQAVLDLMKQKGIRVVSFDDWKKIDAAEVERGKKAGKPREKYVSVEDMLSIL